MYRRLQRFTRSHPVKTHACGHRARVSHAYDVQCMLSYQMPGSTRNEMQVDHALLRSYIRSTCDEHDFSIQVLAALGQHSFLRDDAQVYNRAVAAPPMTCVPRRQSLNWSDVRTTASQNGRHNSLLQIKMLLHSRCTRARLMPTSVFILLNTCGDERTSSQCDRENCRLPPQCEHRSWLEHHCHLRLRLQLHE
ncbi:hypothetical protein BV20DRAFT_417181 [Pilatotrama ljubarskyi]|nr:hypothetical protein BV20DRAFT_417181 [Pilatotrama ljubarskyi]